VHYNMQISRFVQTSRLNSVEAAVVKSTYPDNETPKVKHVKNLIDLIKSEMCSTGFVHQKKDDEYDLIRLLSKRLRNGIKNWQIVLKTLSVTNTLLREADIEFTKQLTRRPFLRSGQSFWDPAEPDISRFIQAFSKYLQDKLQSFVDLDFSVERKIGVGTDFLKQYNYKQLGWILPRVATQMESLTGCQATCNSSEGLPPIVAGVLRELIKDGLRLYSAFTLSVFLVLEQFQKLTISQQKWTAKMGHRYFKINSMFEKWCKELVRWHIIEPKFLPKSWKSIPKSLVTALEEYIQEAENSSPESSSESGSNAHEIRRLSELLGETALNFDSDQKTDTQPGFNFFDDFNQEVPTQNLFDPQPAKPQESFFFDPDEKPLTSNLDDLLSFPSAPKQPKAELKPEIFDPLATGFPAPERASKPPSGQVDLLFDLDQDKPVSLFDSSGPAMSKKAMDTRPKKGVSPFETLPASKPISSDRFARPKATSPFDLPAQNQPPVSLFDSPAQPTDLFFDPLVPTSAPFTTAPTSVPFSNAPATSATFKSAPTSVPFSAVPTSAPFTNEPADLLFFDAPGPSGASASLFDPPTANDFAFGQTKKNRASNKLPLDQNLFD